MDTLHYNLTLTHSFTVKDTITSPEVFKSLLFSVGKMVCVIWFRCDLITSSTSSFSETKTENPNNGSINKSDPHRNQAFTVY